MTDAVKTHCTAKPLPLSAAKAALNASINQGACGAVESMQHAMSGQIASGGPLVVSMEIKPQFVKAVVAKAREMFPGFQVATEPAGFNTKVIVRDPRAARTA